MILGVWPPGSQGHGVLFRFQIGSQFRAPQIFEVLSKNCDVIISFVFIIIRIHVADKAELRSWELFRIKLYSEIFFVLFPQIKEMHWEFKTVYFFFKYVTQLQQLYLICATILNCHNVLQVLENFVLYFNINRCHLLILNGHT